MRGKTVVITGATSGIGEAAAIKLAAIGARIVFTARDRDRGEATLQRLRRAGTGIDHRVHYADLLRLSEMKRVAGEIAKSEPRIDVLMNNAGGVFDRRDVTEDGLERTFALNHMSYVVVTHLLLDRLRATPGARIVNTSSDAHRSGKVNFDDLQLASKYRPLAAYSNTKLYNVLFTRELANRLQCTGVVANALHPGFVATRIADHARGVFASLFRLAMYFALEPEDGAKTMIFLASDKEAGATSGGYFFKCAPQEPAPAALDANAAKRLYAESMKLAGLSN